MLSAMGSSVFELRMGGLPFARGEADHVWRYRHAVRPEGPTALDHQVVSDFLANESAHGRRVTVIADAALSQWKTWGAPETRPHPGEFATQCCTHVYPRGCTARLVCHGAPASRARRILADGALRPAIALTGRAASDLAAASTWGEPADYFEHVVLANGRCTAPEAVAYSRVSGRDLVPADLSPGYPPAVRFYFDWETLGVRSDARFDGVHPVKIQGDLRLGEALVAVVVHADQRDTVAVGRSLLRERLVILDVERPSPEAWATAALAAARELA